MPRGWKRTNVSKTPDKCFSPSLSKLSGQCKISRARDKIINLEFVTKSRCESGPIGFHHSRPGLVEARRMTCDANVTVQVDSPFSNISKGLKTFEVKGA